MPQSRLSGIVLHPTSLPGSYGIGDLGPAAFEFVDFLSLSGCRMWQVMPLGPTGFGDSPYQCFSAFAGNPLMISPELLVEEGYLERLDLETAESFPEDRVDFETVIPWKMKLLEKAYEGFLAHATTWQKRRFQGFCDGEAQESWLEDYALYRSIKDSLEGKEWTKWPHELIVRDPQSILRVRKELQVPIERRKFYQWVFAEQWDSLRRHAKSNGVKILGDIPIFVAHDSADCWGAPEQFFLDPTGNPTVVAGVPPDYFSATGQLWGNPLYRWDVMEEDKFRWWRQRLRHSFSLYDTVRLDHFRGFEAYWEVPAGDDTAMNGKWVKAPGHALFTALEEELGAAPIVAEDLGLITEPVRALRDEFGYPGMKILQFAFGDDASNEYLPHNIEKNCVVYTGTHDNDTTLGWYESLTAPVQDRVRRYLGQDGSDICWDLIRQALASVGNIALFPMQDVLALDSSGRMNTPGKSDGNWSWRYKREQITEAMVNRLAELNFLYGR